MSSTIQKRFIVVGQIKRSQYIKYDICCLNNKILPSFNDHPLEREILDLETLVVTLEPVLDPPLDPLDALELPREPLELPL